MTKTQKIITATGVIIVFLFSLKLGIHESCFKEASAAPYSCLIGTLIVRPTFLALILAVPVLILDWIWIIRSHKGKYLFKRFLKRESIVAVAFFLLGIAYTYYASPFLFGNFIRYAQQQSQINSPIEASFAVTSPLRTAINQVNKEGYTVWDTSTWDNKNYSFNILIGTMSGSADGYAKKAFFFNNGQYLGTDASDISASVEEVWRDDKIIALSYRLYKKDEPLCCPTGGSKTVRFQWNGNKVVVLDPIPTTDWSVDGHR